jgi:8-oxo-dGTP diphosphatase
MNESELPALTERPAVSVDVAVFSVRAHDLKVLLVRRGAAPFRGRWALPGGFGRLAEALDDAARRMLPAETDGRDVCLEQLYTFGAPCRDPRSRVISVAYFAWVAADIDARTTQDGAGAGWHSISALPELAFDHADILQVGLQRLRYKLEYSAAGFELLPNEFTLTEFQAAYEIVLGERLDKRNFRRRILEAEILNATNRYRESEGQGRPARLYRYQKNSAIEVKARRLFA